jgi:hypothetical protein
MTPTDADELERWLWNERNKKADVGEHPEVLNHVGLLFDGPSSEAGVPFV